MDYFINYLKVAPISHAIWRSKEAYCLLKLTGNKFERPILDLGCGFGEFAGVFYDNLVECGIDVSREDLIVAAKKKKFRDLVWADARKMPFHDESFSTVLSISVLEHIKDVDKVFKEVYRVLKKDGLFIFSVPTKEINRKLIGARILRSLGLFRLEEFYIKIFHQSFVHKNIFSKRKWLSILENTGFKLEGVSSTISSRQLLLFELFLPFALPTQFFRMVFKRRLLFSLGLRVDLLSLLFSRFLDDDIDNWVNIMVKARK